MSLFVGHAMLLAHNVPQLFPGSKYNA